MLDRRGLITGAVTLATLTIGAVCTAAPAHAQSQSVPSWDRGNGRRWAMENPRERPGAWDVEHDWAEPISSEPDAPSYAEAYADYVLENADSWVGRRDLKRDCADFSISLLITYASDNGLPVPLRVYFSSLRRFISVSSEDAGWRSAAHFDDWARWHLGAMNLADNTVPVTYETWRAGDMVLMDWNQTESSPNFPGRVVWHTYLVGEPGETAYYGNLSGGQPTPIAKLTSVSQIRGRLIEHPDRHGLSPRRWRFLNVERRAPTPEPDEGDLTGTGRVDASRLNVRAGPGTGNAILDVLDRGDEVRVTGRDGDWLAIVLDDGRPAWTYAPLIDEDEAVAKEARVTVSLGNVRGGPGTGNGVRDQVRRDDVVTVLSRRGRWLRLAGAEERWVHDSLVSFEAPVVTASVAPPPRAPTAGILGALDDD